MSLQDVKLAVINADLGTTGSLNDQEKAFYDAALTANGVLTKTVVIEPTGDVSALTIDSDAVTEHVVNILANMLTSKVALRVRSDSTSAAARNVVSFINVNTAATGAVVLSAKQGAANEVILLTQDAASSFINFAGTAAATTTDPISTLTTSGATTNHIQVEINGTKAWIAVSTTDPT